MSDLERWAFAWRSIERSVSDPDKEAIMRECGASTFADAVHALVKSEVRRIGAAARALLAQPPLARGEGWG